MVQRIIDGLRALKAQRNITLSHWRLKWIYYFLGIDQPKTIAQAKAEGVPACFFSHWCPLFWASWAVIIFTLIIPVIPVIKTVILFCKGVKFCWTDGIVPAWEWLTDTGREWRKRKAAESTPA